MQRNQAFADAALHARNVETGVQQALVLFERAESARRAYLLSQDDRALQVHAEAGGALTEALDGLARATADNPSQQRRLNILREALIERAAVRDRTIVLARDGRVEEARDLFGAELPLLQVTRVRQLLAEMTAEEERLLSSRSEERRATGRWSVIALFALLPLLALVAVGTLWALYRHTTDLDRSRSALRQLNLGLEQAVDGRTQDLRQANEEIQRFAYIVSHDLRSPLVNVMGFTSEIEAGRDALSGLLERAEQEAPQIVDREVAEFVRTDLPEAIGFIRSSTAKMDRLINAILRLSREGRRVLSPEPLNMQVLLDGVANTLRSRADALGAEVKVQWPIPDLVNDRLAMEQVFGNLLDNALKYLSPDRAGRVVVTGRSEGGRRIFEVRDNGRGIDPRDHERVFDLFRRAGVQDQPGEGIGLAHVRALVQRLGGSITVESELDKGAMFRVSLPPTLNSEGSRPA